jgi:hypothetical protein
MPLKKISLKPGVNRENTRYTNEGGYYESNLVRFRQGTPEKIGGWLQISASTFLGVCRSLWNWVTLGAQNLMGVGTNLKYYIENGGAYYDITPIRAESTLTNPFTTVYLSTTITVTDASGGYSNGDFVTFSPSVTVGGITIGGEYQITASTGATTYTITSTSAATSGATGGGTVYAVYQVSVGPEYAVPLSGWGAGPWGGGTWGVGSTASDSIRIWNASNFGQDLVYGPRGGALYLWNANIGISSPAVTITIASPAVVTSTFTIVNNTAIQLQTTGALPTGLTVGTTYYIKYLTSTTFNLATSATSSAVLSGVVITGTAGQFSCTASSVPLAIGQSLTIIGTYGGTGSITGYANPTTYYIIATNGSTTFTLSTTAGGSGVTTTAGTPTGLTYTLSTTINTSGTQSGVNSVSVRGIPLSSLNGASSVPLYQNYLLISDVSRITIVFGTNDYGSTTLDPMLIRWSDKESLVEWQPSATTEAGSVRFSHGSRIVTALQSRQEIVVWTDSTIYSMQYAGPPNVFNTQLLADNVSIAGPNAMAVAANVVYWMGVDKFYKYDGRVQTLRCDLRQFIYSDINPLQFDQVYSSTNEGFNEVWWFYCTENSNQIDRYVVYNYFEDVWYYGSLGRTAWIDTGLRSYPVAATYSNNLVNQEYGVDDGTSGTLVPMESFITTSQFDIDDGHNFAFVWRMLPDLTFRGSTDGTEPSLTIQLQPLQNSGSSYNSPISVGGTSSTGTQTVNTAKNGIAPLYTYPQDPDIFTGQLNIRVRGRQMSMKITCNTLGTQWQLGAPRIDIRADGRR